MSEKRTFLVLDYILSIVVFLVTIAYMVTTLLWYPLNLVTDFPVYNFLIFQCLVLLFCLPYIFWRKKDIHKLFCISFIIFEVVFCLYQFIIFLVLICR